MSPTTLNTVQHRLPRPRGHGRDGHDRRLCGPARQERRHQAGPPCSSVKNDAPIDWPSFDGKPVDVAIALLVPDDEAGTVHIRLLSKTAVLLKKDEFKALVRGTDDPQAIADAVNAGIEDE